MTTQTNTQQDSSPKNLRAMTWGQVKTWGCAITSPTSPSSHSFKDLPIILLSDEAYTLPQMAFSLLTAQSGYTLVHTLALLISGQVIQEPATAHYMLQLGRPNGFPLDLQISNLLMFILYLKWLKELYSAESLQLSLTLCDSMDCSLLGSSVHGILQARIQKWVAISFSRGSSQLKYWTYVSCIAGGFFTHWITWEARLVYR